jgi:cold-inducible RNA-binding protein
MCILFYFILFSQKMDIYVGNLNYKVREEEIKDLFADFGDVKSVKLVKDQETGRSRGFAFVEMAEDSAANEAIQALNETDFFDRTLIVKMARPKDSSDRPRSNGGGGGFKRRPSNGGGGGYRNNY